MFDIEPIFKVLLGRIPNGIERRIYKNLSERQLIELLSYCEERSNFLKKLSGEHNKVRVDYSAGDTADFFTSKKYKVALCLSGHIRDYKKNLSSISKYLVEPLGADVFMHCWDTEGAQTWMTRGVVGPVPNETIPVDEEEIRKCINVKKLLIENNSEYLAGLKTDDKNFYLYGMILNREQDLLGGQAEPKYIYSQLYSVNKSYSLIDDPSEYDIIIKLRTDYRLMSGIEEKELDRSLQVNGIYVPDFPCSNHGHPCCCFCKHEVAHEEHLEDVCDVFAYGRADIMGHYMNLYNRLDEYNDLHNSLNKSFPRPAVSQAAHKNYQLVDIWVKDDYKFNCFYPERLLRTHLKGYQLLPSKLYGEVLRPK